MSSHIDNRNDERNCKAQQCGELIRASFATQMKAT